MTQPTDIWFPKGSNQWSSGVRDRFAERLCIWSDGGRITLDMYRVATAEAEKEHAQGL